MTAAAGGGRALGPAHCHLFGGSVTGWALGSTLAREASGIWWCPLLGLCRPSELEFGAGCPGAPRLLRASLGPQRPPQSPQLEGQQLP